MSIVNDSHHQNQLLRVRLSKCRLEDVMENRNPSQKHSWQAQQPLNTDMHRHANDMHRHAQTRDFKNETTCTDTRNNLFFRVIGHSRRFAWSWGRRRSHQTWVVRSMSQHVKQVKNSVPQNMTNKTSITTVHMQTWSMTTCTYTHAFSRQQVCFPVRVHLSSYGTKVRHHGVQGHSVQKTMSDFWLRHSKRRCQRLRHSKRRCRETSSFQNPRPSSTKTQYSSLPSGYVVQVQPSNVGPSSMANWSCSWPSSNHCKGLGFFGSISTFAHQCFNSRTTPFLCEAITWVAASDKNPQTPQTNRHQTQNP